MAVFAHSEASTFAREGARPQRSVERPPPSAKSPWFHIWLRVGVRLPAQEVVEQDTYLAPSRRTHESVARANAHQSSKQASDLGTLLAFVAAGIGGAFPMQAEPLARTGGMISVVSRLTPHAHAVEGFYSLMAEGATFGQILPEIGVLLLMGAVFFAVAVWQFRFE